MSTKSLAFLSIIAVILTVVVAVSPSKMVCYFPSWSAYRQGMWKFTIAKVDVSLCTHIIYSFSTLDPRTYAMESHDDWLDIQSGNFAKAVALKREKPELKVLIAIGGWTDSQSNKYSQMVSTAGNRHNFVESVMNFLQAHGFDGLDIDWEFPGSNDKHNFAQLIKTLRARFGTRYLLSLAVSANPMTIDSGYDVPVINKNCDFISVMAYDYHGTWESNPDHHAPLYSRPWESGINAQFNVNSSATHWLQKGMSPHKLVLGIPIYGRSWKLAGPFSPKTPPNALGAGAANPGMISQSPGTLAFFEICSNIKNQAWSVITNGEVAGPFAFSSALDWVGYDDQAMVTEKAKYVRQNGLGGAMVWDISMDDFNNYCGLGYNPIQTTIVAALTRGQMPFSPSINRIETVAPVFPSSLPTVPMFSTMNTKIACRGDGFYASPTSCNKYYHCGRGKATLMLCPPGTLFNGVLCDWSYNVKCPSKHSHQQVYSTFVKPQIQIASSTYTPPEAFICPGTGLYASRNDARKFYSCAERGVGTDMFCASGTVFHPAMKICTWPNAVRD